MAPADAPDAGLNYTSAGAYLIGSAATGWFVDWFLLGKFAAGSVLASIGTGLTGLIAWGASGFYSSLDSYYAWLESLVIALLGWGPDSLTLTTSHSRTQLLGPDWGVLALPVAFGVAFAIAAIINRGGDYLG